MTISYRYSFLVIVAVVAALSMILVGGYTTRIQRDIDNQVASSSLVAAPHGRVAGTEYQVAPGEVNLTINFGAATKHFVFAVQGGETVLDLLNQASLRNNLVVASEQYQGIGTLITQIGDQKNGTDNKYWLYSINGNPATKAVDQQVIQAGDQIEFKFAAL